MRTHPVGRMIAIAASTAALAMLLLTSSGPAQTLPTVDVEGQPLANNVKRLLQALDVLGAPLPAEKARALQAALDTQDAGKIQQLLDPQVIVVVSLNPEARVKAKRGPAEAVLQQGGYTPVLVKLINESTVTKPLKILSPQALPIY